MVFPQHDPILFQIPEISILTFKEKKLLYHKYYEDKTDKEIAGF